MQKPSANQMRQLVEEAQRRKRCEAADAQERQAREEQAAKRRESVWLALYSAAVQGYKEPEIPNLSEEDIAYFRTLGMTIVDLGLLEPIYSSYEEKLEWLESTGQQSEEQLFDLDIRIIELECEIEDAKDPSIPFDTSALQSWIRSHGTLAYQCDLEDWFDVEEADLSSASEVEWTADTLIQLKQQVEKRHAATKLPETSKALGSLLKAIAKAEKTIRPPYDFFGAEKLLIELEARKIELEKLISKIDEQSFDFNRESFTLADPGPTTSIHTVAWTNLHVDLPKVTASFSPYALSWLSSKPGQDEICQITELIAAFAEEGKSILKLRFNRDDDGIALHCSQDEIDIFFPSLFDLRQALQSLGYKVAGTSSTAKSGEITIRW